MAFHYLSAGESHGPALTVIVEGVPAGLPLDEDLLAADLAKRQLKAGAGGRMEIETDRATILAGVMAGRTTGAPIALSIPNRDHAAWKGKSVSAYTVARPGHADLAACVKYGFDDIRPALERSSARETACRVAVGAIARAFLAKFGITASSYVAALGTVPESQTPLREALDFAANSPSRAPSQAQEDAYTNAIHLARSKGETLGGVGGLHHGDLGGLGIVPGILLILGAVHAGIVCHANDHAGIDAGISNGKERVGGHVESHVLHAAEAALAGQAGAQGGLHGDLLIGRPFGINLLVLGGGFGDLGAGGAGVAGDEAASSLVESPRHSFVAEHQLFHGVSSFGLVWSPMESFTETTTLRS